MFFKDSFKNWLLATLLMILMAACSSSNKSELTAICPRAVLITDLSRYPVPNGAIILQQVSTTCAGKRLDITLDIVRSASDLQLKDIEIKAFIATIDNHNKIKDRQIITISNTFKENQLQCIAKRQYHLPTGFDENKMRIVVGFTLTQQQQHQNYLDNARQLQQLENHQERIQKRIQLPK